MPPDQARRCWGGLIIEVWRLQASTSDVHMQIPSGFHGLAHRALGRDSCLSEFLPWNFRLLTFLECALCMLAFGQRRWQWTALYVARTHVDALNTRGCWRWRGNGCIEWRRRRDPIGVVVGRQCSGSRQVCIDLLALHACALPGVRLVHCTSVHSLPNEHCSCKGTPKGIALGNSCQLEES